MIVLVGAGAVAAVVEGQSVLAAVRWIPPCLVVQPFQTHDERVLSCPLFLDIPAYSFPLVHRTSNLAPPVRASL